MGAAVEVAAGAGVAGRDGREVFVGVGLEVGVVEGREGEVVAVSISLAVWSLD